MPSGASDNDLRIAISLSFESFALAWTSGDIDAFLNQWTPDGIFWPPDGEELNGPKAIRAWAIQLGRTANLTVKPLHVERIGDFTFVVGDFTQDVTLQGQLVHFRGGFTSILRNAGDGWKVHRLVSFQERAVPT